MLFWGTGGEGELNKKDEVTNTTRWETCIYSQGTRSFHCWRPGTETCSTPTTPEKGHKNKPTKNTFPHTSPSQKKKQSKTISQKPCTSLPTQQISPPPPPERKGNTYKSLPAKSTKATNPPPPREKNERTDTHKNKNKKIPPNPPPPPPAKIKDTHTHTPTQKQ